MDDRATREIEEAQARWERETLRPALGRAPERARFLTSWDTPVPRLSTAQDVAGLDYLRDLGFPGEYPFVRGVQPTMYRGRLWTMRQYAGFGTAGETNRRFRYLLSQGQTGLSVAFDLPTQMGYDADAPAARDRHVQREQDGRGGVDGHGGGDALEGDAVEKRLHVLQAVDGDAHPAHFAPGKGVVRVVADLGGQVEGHGEAGGSLAQEIPVSPVGLGRGTEAGVLAHRPETAAVARLVEAPGEGIGPGFTYILQ